LKQSGMSDTMQTSPSDLLPWKQTQPTPWRIIDTADATSKNADCETWMTPFHLKHTLEIEDRATTVGSSLSESCDDSFGDQLDDDGLAHEDESDEEEAGAQEESEFSLDGRLASIKRWRRFQALEQKTGTGSPMAASSILPASVCGTLLPEHFDMQGTPLSAESLPQAYSLDHCFSPAGEIKPTLPSGASKMQCTGIEEGRTLPLLSGLSGIHCSVPEEVTQLPLLPGLSEMQCVRPEEVTERPLPPGLSGVQCAAAPAQTSVPLPMPSQLSFNLLSMSASLLPQSSVIELESRIRLLSQHALGVDAWEDLLEPETGDPEWHLLALMGKEFLAGFSTYAFFPEDCDDGSSGLIMSVHHMVAAKVFRGMGHGRTMLEDLLARARSANAWAVKLFSKPAAVGFYERMGFKLAGYENEDGDHLMEVRLLQ